MAGDTLFINSCGRIDLPGSSPEDMYYSLQTLSKLVDETRLFPGHNYSGQPSDTLGQPEKAQHVSAPDHPQPTGIPVGDGLLSTPMRKKRGNFLEDFRAGQHFRHKVGKTLTEGLFNAFTEFGMTTNPLSKTCATPPATAIAAWSPRRAWS